MRIRSRLETYLNTMEETIDVGYGFRPRGHANVDVCRVVWNPQTGVGNELRDIKRIPNFVQADGQYLLFKDDMFEAVLSRETIEHVNNPFFSLWTRSRQQQQSSSLPRHTGLLEEAIHFINSTSQ